MSKLHFCMVLLKKWSTWIAHLEWMTLDLKILYFWEYVSLDKFRQPNSTIQTLLPSWKILVSKVGYCIFCCCSGYSYYGHFDRSWVATVDIFKSKQQQWLWSMCSKCWKHHYANDCTGKGKKVIGQYVRIFSPFDENKKLKRMAYFVKNI